MAAESQPGLARSCPVLLRSCSGHAPVSHCHCSKLAYLVCLGFFHGMRSYHSAGRFLPLPATTVDAAAMPPVDVSGLASHAMMQLWEVPHRLCQMYAPAPQSRFSLLHPPSTSAHHRLPHHLIAAFPRSISRLTLELTEPPEVLFRLSLPVPHRRRPPRSNMRYQDWDILLFPGGSNEPLKEFRVACHVVNDVGKTPWGRVVSLRVENGFPEVVVSLSVNCSLR